MHRLSGAGVGEGQDGGGGGDAPDGDGGRALRPASSAAPSLRALSSPRALPAMWSTQVMRSLFTRPAVTGPLNRSSTLGVASSAIRVNPSRSVLATLRVHRRRLMHLRRLHCRRNDPAALRRNGAARTSRHVTAGERAHLADGHGRAGRVARAHQENGRQRT
jgi:hypothetical protein